MIPASTVPRLIGSVAYSPNVVTVWEGMRAYFTGTDTPIDFVLFSNYGRLVDALIGGTVDLAWNTNLAYVRTLLQTKGACRALASRDTDVVFQSVFVSRAGTGFDGLEAVRGRRLALGSRDSAQAAILPLQYLHEAGIGDDDVTLMRIDSDVGKHGDTGRSELDALRAVLDDRADAAAIGVNTWQAITRGEIMTGAIESFWMSPEYSHCTFTALPALSTEWAEAWLADLFAMDWENPDHRAILELEGLRRWVPPNLDGYGSLIAAVAEQGIPDRW
ncbi:PhnD/SsuA/transferrin family substrate-binding protein [Agromyces sp. SYSU K20354]|uniref:Rv1680 family SBP-like protein n=1 Tax=Agromyces cavernae TaxID=2898659 RepID=UPI001E319E11|nr:PhnD/SsuA/transferrin family substrate-binding protein [Agromyces cavernae]MCD2442051.1 PhnD/SsuA/transferrin family substrate-binding protein [Agromyces cavernae]